MKRWWTFRIKTTALVLSLALAAFFFFGLNAALIARLYAIGQTEAMKIGFVMSLPVFFISAFNLLFLPFAGRRTAKPVFIALLLISAMVSYATYNYGVIFSREMIANVAETDYAEASSYLNLSAFLWLFLLGIVPAVFVSRLTIVPSRRKYAHPLFSALGSALAIAAIAGLYYQDYAMTIRNYADLKRMVVPTYALSSGYKYTQQKYFASAAPYLPIAADARQTMSEGSKKQLTVLIVGETARASNYQLGGYARKTNEYTAALDVDFYANVTSCGTETAVSVPCMFSNLTRTHYSLGKAESQDNLLDVLKRANVQLLWLENNGGCKGVCKNIDMVDIRKEYASNPDICDSSGCLDEAFILELEKKLPTLKNENTVIVLHLMGSHGPAYYKRYPKTFGAFQPDCKRSDVQNCPAQALMNTYDNTIHYTDYVLSRVIRVLQGQQDRWGTAMFYLSDHGESLGENGVYLHGLPYSIAPKQQKHIPLMTWFSPSFLEGNHLNRKCMKTGTSREYSQDNLFHTMLGLTGIATDAYKKEMDMFSSCRE
ncbi:MAG: phosphoethanolamine--lipid A transferase [Pseudomonadota bacterium]